MDGQILFFKNASITMSTTIKISAPDKGDIWVSKCLSPGQTSTCNLGNNLNQSIEEGTKLKITVLPTQTAGKESAISIFRLKLTGYRLPHNPDRDLLMFL